MSVFIDPEVATTFRPTEAGFASRSAGGVISCPPFVIASIAASERTPAGAITLPDGYDRDALERIMDLSGFVDRDVAISPRQAAELAVIGSQILDLNDHRKVDPPLGFFERMSVMHLVKVVDEAAGRQSTGRRRPGNARPGPAELDFPQTPPTASPQWPVPPAAHAPGPPGLTGRANSSPVSRPRPGPR